MSGFEASLFESNRYDDKKSQNPLFLLAKFIHKKEPSEDALDENGRMIYFSTDPPESSEGDSDTKTAPNSSNSSKATEFDRLTSPEEEMFGDEDGEKKKRIGTINNLIEGEKRELGNIQTLIKKQSKSLDRAKKLLREKQMLLQTEFDRKAYRFTSNEKFSIMGELSSKMAHDIRNPLNVIKVQVDLLKLRYSKNQDKIMLESLGRMERAVYGITNQLDDILNFLRNSPLNIDDHGILKILSESLLSINIPDNITIELPRNDVTISCDAYKMQRVFTNLIQNSIQAIEKEGTITIQVSESDNDLSIAIIDTGKGIPQDVIPKIFEPLFTTKVAGTGLGLAICKKIVEDHKGSISVKNNPTTFFIKIPKID